MEYTSGTSTWRSVLRRLLLPLRPAARVPGERRRSVWSWLVPVVALLAGLLFTTSATVAHGTDLREDRTPQLANLIADRQRQVAAAQAQAATLRAGELATLDQQGNLEPDVQAQQERAAAELSGAGLVALHGPGLTVALNDAPTSPDGSLPKGATADDVVVHQQDVQAVVNALWAGGAEAMTIMGVRVISTSAVRCVGNTLLLDGVLYSPPFTISAIGDPKALQAALDASDAIGAYRQAVAAWGLGYDVRQEGDITMPAYNGSTDLQYATPIR
jgi:uncharacterized protein YlxW (UPF0749 family)